MRAAQNIVVFIVLYLFNVSLAISSDVPGEILWSKSFDYGLNHKPVVDRHGNLYVDANDKLWSFDKEGNERWQVNFPGPNGGTPYNILVASNDLIYVTHGFNYLTAYDNLGRIHWHKTYFIGSSTRPVELNNGNILIVSFHDSNSILLEVTPQGNISMFHEGEGDEYQLSQPMVSPEGFVVVNTKNGIRTFDHETNILWEYDLDLRPMSSPISDGQGNIYIATTSNSLTTRSEAYLYSFSIDGSVNWKVDLPNNAKTEPLIDQAGNIIVFSKGSNFVASDDKGSVSAYNREGEHLWSVNSRGTPFLARDDGSILTTTDTGTYSLVKNGQILKSENFHLLRNDIVLNESGIMYAVANGSLYAFRTDGIALAKSSWPLRGQNPRNSGNSNGLIIDIDTDADGIPDHSDNDDDNDGVPDNEDVFPLNTSEWLDTDFDGEGDNYDVDSDNDGIVNLLDTDDNNDGIEDENGGINWHASTTEGRIEAGSSAVTIGFDGRIISSHGQVLSVSDKNGNLLWQKYLGPQITHTIVNEDGVILVGARQIPLHPTLFGFDLDGNELWRKGVGTIVSMATDRNSGAFLFTSVSGNIGSVNPDGSYNWLDRELSERWYGNILMTHEGIFHVYGAKGQQGNLYAIDMLGNILWSTPKDSVENGPILGAEGEIYIAAEGQLQKLDSEGNVIWKTATIDIQGMILDKKGNIYLSSGSVLTGIRSDGSFLFGYDYNSVNLRDFGHFPYISRENFGEPAITEDGIILHPVEGMLFAISTNNTALKHRDAQLETRRFTDIHPLIWAIDTGSQEAHSPTIDGEGNIIFSSSDGQLFSINNTSGILQNSPWPKYGGNLQNSVQNSKYIADFDLDGIPNDRDDDIDNDGVANTADDLPYKASEHSDSDGDGWGDESDIDNDNDGYTNEIDLFPFDSMNNKDAKILNAKWKLNLSDLSAREATPAINSKGDVIFTNSDGTIYAFDTNGKMRWHYRLTATRSYPAVIDEADNIHIAGERSGHIWTFSEQGDLLRFVDTEEFSLSSAPVIDGDGTMYIGGYDNLLALDQMGNIKWKTPLSAPPNYLSIGKDGDIFFAVSGPNTSSIIYSVSPSGTVNWYKEVNSRYSSNLQIAIGPDGTLYYGNTTENKFYAVNPDGSEKWEYEFDYWVAFPYSPLVDANDNVYASTDHGVKVFDKMGNLKWSGGVNGMSSAPVLTRDNKIILTGSGIIAYDTSGTLLWEKEYRAFEANMDNNGNLFFSHGTSGGKLTALNTGFSGLAKVGWAKTAGNARRTGQYSEKPRSPYDYNGDNLADIAVRRPSTFYQYYKASSSGDIGRELFGKNEQDISVEGDFDGDKKSDIAVWRPSNQMWYVRKSSDNGIIRQKLGVSASDLPVPGDYNGDEITDFAIYSQSTNLWHIVLNGTSSVETYSVGIGEDLMPVPADYDGDGITDVAVREPETYTWTVLHSSDHTERATTFGRHPGDIPVPADYDGDGKADIAVRRASNQYWYILQSSDSEIRRINFGKNEGDIPIPADYDGDGKVDIAVRRPSTQFQYILNSSDWTISRLKFGLDNKDIPLAAPIACKTTSLPISCPSDLSQ